MSEEKIICPVCKLDKNIKRYLNATTIITQYQCPRCGIYNIDRRVDHTIEREPDREVCVKISSWLRNYYESQKEPYTLDWETYLRIESILPDYDVLEKQFILLRNIGIKSKYPGYEVSIFSQIDSPLAWASSDEEFRFHLKSLYRKGYLEIFEESEPPLIVISASGWEYLDKHRSDIQERTQAFVAMSFNPQLKSVWKNSIKPAIEKAGYTALRVDMKPHNEKIDAKIMTEIKNSRFIVSGFTQNKHGVYFEAGYALGLGIPVIWCVKKEELENLHFDTRQYGHIDWENEEELMQKLYNYICAIIGKRK